ncbi:hypothetical protein CPAST_c07540 [Clostridium pasteurianum DSM 525 = ATCC 6013]|uniref:Uncharacterized protein n=2 Tax=Clostridium pasteurianum TaxID=1501 RepID=A0A0H3J0I3_CLOPA|nr:hypothetical protein [Clostridium pasteurianum]AJA46854.1 hypothetical protein CPAST_c07540 [Clostridium pasteurianum DSM 525 = ATCC 6013]AJA50842.1 hypothetical protein CLPA_c07540 [Clostridium pasteurianum DSM 525 = ATCC 6013]AOZ74243.1 hypothetical protein AQ983_03635 [Clostridium pasteurianum DSM 525 = ATCC 6013]AOZ78041.1 hypothetical protein AQ984_03635 [Clostridium pasteurianum]ELP58533.1 hypothetical protein F502_13665 [Clostridium pasteurianum DSM 525 = ATCC 6013]
MRKIGEKLKKSMIPLSISLIFISMAFNRFIVSRYGRDATIIIMGLGVLIAVVATLGILYKKEYVVGLVTLLAMLPFIVMVIGEYFHNDIVSTIGFISIFIALPIITKFINNYNKNRHK